MSNLVEISGVKKGYGISKTVFENLNLALPEGKIIGLLGPNGSGKTTLIKMLVGLLQPEKGSIRICGHEVGTGIKGGCFISAGADVFQRVLKDPSACQYVQGLLCGFR